MGSHSTTDLMRLGSYAELRDFLGRRREAPGSFEEFERELGKRMQVIENDLKAQQLALYDVDGQVIRMGCRPVADAESAPRSTQLRRSQAD